MESVNYQSVTFEPSPEMSEYLKILKKLVPNDETNHEYSCLTDDGNLETVLNAIQYIQYLNQVVTNN